MTETALVHIVGDTVKSLRERAGIPRVKLARACRISTSHLRNIENGFRRATPDTVSALDIHLNADGLLTDLSNAGEDLVRRRSILNGLALLIAPVLPTPAPHRNVGTSDVATLQAITETYRRLDNELGGAQVRDSIARYLNNEATTLLSERYSDHIRHDLFSAVASLAQLAGWTAYDSGMHSVAQRFLQQGKSWADEAANAWLSSQLTSALSHQAAFLGNGKRAVELANEALKQAVASEASSLIAEARLCSAHGEALQGNRTKCARELFRAEQALDRAGTSERPGWIDYLSPAYLHARSGHSLLALGDSKTATDSAEKSLDMDNSYVRGRMFNLALLAKSHLAESEVDQACSVGHEAVNLAENLQSARADTYLHQLATGLLPHRDYTPANNLIQRVSQQLTPVE